MSAATSHPLAAAYLRDLELLLYGLDPGARAEVLTGVREHLSAALGPDATSDQVQAALAELGSPQSIADEAYADRPPLAAAPAPAPSRFPHGGKRSSRARLTPQAWPTCFCCHS